MTNRIMQYKEWIAAGMLDFCWDAMTDPLYLSAFELHIIPEKSIWRTLLRRPSRWQIVHVASGVISLGRFNTREQAVEMMAILVLYGARYIDV